MNPCELNALITAITNHLFVTLSRDDFVCLSIFINELSKSMFTTTLFRDICNKNRDKEKEKYKDKAKADDKDKEKDGDKSDN